MSTRVHKRRDLERIALYYLIRSTTIEDGLNNDKEMSRVLGVVRRQIWVYKDYLCKQGYISYKLNTQKKRIKYYYTESAIRYLQAILADLIKFLGEYKGE